MDDSNIIESTVYSYADIGSIDFPLPVGDVHRKPSYVNSCSLTTICIASVKVSKKRMKKKSNKPFKKLKSKSEGVRDTRLNRLLRPHELSETKYYKPQAAHIHPTFISPLMNGHVSGLKHSRAKPLAKIRKHKFMHEVLTSEHGKRSSHSNCCK